MENNYGDCQFDYYGGRPFQYQWEQKARNAQMYPCQTPDYTAMAPWLKAAMPGNSSDNSKELLQDMEYFSQMYPKEMRQMKEHVAQFCDKIDYEGSIIYDEYPDRIGLNQIRDGIMGAMTEEMQVEDEIARQMIELLLYQDLMARRMNRRYRKKMWVF